MSPAQLPSRGDYFKQWRGGGGKVCAVFPAQYPKELLWAHGVLPMEVWDPPLAPARAQGHLQPYICSVVRQGLELLLAGGMDEVGAILFPHTCDSLQNLASLVADYLEPPAPSLFFYNPKAPFAAAAKGFYVSQLQALEDDLALIFGPAPEGAMEQALEWSRRLSELYARAYARRAAGELGVGAAEFYRLLRAGEYLHPQDYIPLLEAWLNEAPAQGGPQGQGILLSGVLPSPPDLMETLDGLDLRVVHDDLLSMSRRLLYPPPGKGGPLEALADCFLAMPPCSTRGSSLSERLEWLGGLAQSGGAQGVVFSVVKFCEPELFDLPELRRGLKEAGLPSLVLEVDVNQEVGGQAATRLEAFGEMLS
ncbi:MAG: 2-hydroxyacyl-CoA dehydratase family protein [Proteobacteria bacterium]|nr:2-hydroxyacyl-CoA dehydratase family protein [Pseudomonadota bacterium]MBU4381617.1 2-hydroxyacyl-CoA dehydratase family protein [Pseudomonadota bacterium]MBU4604950.1 2-hydroxyacyl-CoA dehydratase family protein [Pseudomonadota bacterium]MCG2766604.1 2-hydroxyacyl-CoA dehydratase family protein [Desulfarculaceae bacterium]